MNFLILGAGSHGQSIKEIAENLRVFKKIAFLDDDQKGDDIIGKCTDAIKLRDEYPCAFVAIGDNKLRRKYAKYLKECGFLIPNIVSEAIGDLVYKGSVYDKYIKRLIDIVLSFSRLVFCYRFI